jgi:hypothetical protein
MFDTLPKSVESLMKVLNFTYVSSEYPNKRYADEIFGDLGDVPSDDDIRELLSKEVYWNNHKNWRKVWETKDKETRYALMKEAQAKDDKDTEAAFLKFKDTYKNKIIRIVTYGDDDGSFYSELEHGGLFDSMESIRISHH